MRSAVWKAVAASTVVLAAAGIAPRVVGPAAVERIRAAAAALASPRAGEVLATGVARTAADLGRLVDALPPVALPIAVAVAILAGLGAVLAARTGARRPPRRSPVRAHRGRDRVLGMVAGGRPVHGVARRMGLAQDGVRVLLHTAALDRPLPPGRIFRPAGSAGAVNGLTGRATRA